eukprot:14359841-Alexandrium_andersonii.AAC.1
MCWPAFRRRSSSSALEHSKKNKGAKLKVPMGDGLGMGVFGAVRVVRRQRACFGQASDPTNRCVHWHIRNLHGK